ATLHTRGTDLDLGPGTRATLPTYPFQHQRYWTENTGVAAPASRFGLADAGHPLLGAAIELPGLDGVVYSGRLSVSAQPWLADHVIGGVVLVPGAALVELAVHAADAVGCSVVEELTTITPLVLPADAGVQLRIRVGEPDGEDHRPLEIHSRPEGADAWTTHAIGSVAAVPVDSPGTVVEWPPSGARPVDLTGGYDRLAERGHEYGQAFRAVTAVWRRGDEFYADVELPDTAERFALHPALLDAALHAPLLAGPDDDGPALLPFSWQRVVLHATNATALRVRIAPSGSGWSLSATDGAGAPVVSVGRLETRPAGPLETPAANHDSLYELSWIPSPVAASPADDVTVLDTTTLGLGAEDTPTRVHTTVNRVLDEIRTWLDDPAGSRLVVRTEGAVALPGEGVTDLAGAAVWGLVRSVQVEHP
ncbi:polyketide synthase dehydratase domain-containing protein, partial [Actinoplanes sp. NPDC049802]|uniref:polyketide synthase dehydratase domain-containing protein n=1 Tax=Actinoplanes sp. NPDC049802 TaxID=3154742 RepID=UPI0033F5D0DD